MLNALRPTRPARLSPAYFLVVVLAALAPLAGCKGTTSAPQVYPAGEAGAPPPTAGAPASERGFVGRAFERVGAALRFEVTGSRAGVWVEYGDLFGGDAEAVGRDRAAEPLDGVQILPRPLYDK